MTPVHEAILEFHAQFKDRKINLATYDEMYAFISKRPPEVRLGLLMLLPLSTTLGPGISHIVDQIKKK